MELASSEAQVGRQEPSKDPNATLHLHWLEDEHGDLVSSRGMPK